MRNFRKLNIWHLSMDLTVEIYTLSAELPSNERYGLRSQLTRAAVSVPSNIAEGSRGSEKEMVNFLRYSIGSLNELETQFILCKKLNLIESYLVDDIIKKITIVQSKVGAYIKYIKSKTY